MVQKRFNSKGNKQPEISEKHELYFFSEEKYMKDRPEEFDELRKSLLREVPQQENIYECNFIFIGFLLIF